VHNYLGGSSHYIQFGEDIGVVERLKEQLGCIAITIFARRCDVESGAFEVLGLGEQVMQGVNLGFGRAGNKGRREHIYAFHHLSSRFPSSSSMHDGHRLQLYS